MARMDPLFRFEIILEDLKSFVKKKQFIIKSQFADVFSLVLRDPMEQVQSLLKIKKPKGKRGKGKNTMSEVPPKVVTGQSVLFTSNIDELISYMMQYPMEICLWSKKEPESRIGSTVIPWNPAFVEFLARLYKGEKPRPVVVYDTRNVFDELTSKRMAIIKLVIKMSHVLAPAPLQFKGNLEKKTSPVYPYISNKSNTLSTEKRPWNLRHETGVIKTFYSGGKRKHKSHSKSKKRTEREDLSTAIEHSDVKEIQHSDVKEIQHSDVKEIRHSDVKEIRHSEVKEIEHSDVLEIKHSDVLEIKDSDVLEIKHSDVLENENNDVIEMKRSDVLEVEHNDVIEMKHSYVNEVKNEITISKCLLTLIRSDTDIDRKAPLSVTQIKSCSSIKPPNNLNYNFNDQAGRYGNKIYTVGYLAVESIPSQSSKGDESSESFSSSKTDKSSKTSSKTKSDATGESSTTKLEESQSKSSSTTSSKKKYSFRLCAPDCPAQDKTPNAQFEATLDLPESARNLISITKCDDVRCFYKPERPPTNVPREGMLLTLPTRQNPCCVTTVQEQVIGMKAHMTVEDTCSCACDCLFYGKNTTYCSVCGGYLDAGNDTSGRPHYLMPPPCPIYHRIEKKKGSSKSSGSESRKKVERVKKRKERIIDKRFKFKYGFVGIPAQIGHSQCAMPCTGHMNNVPNGMGWLWNADNVPGLPFRPQYRPGAISKFVLRLLRMAGHPDKVAKKRRKDMGKKKRQKRPLLIVHKKDGEYSVTMETMKPYVKQRTVNQPPYEDKDPVLYTIGRTEEENRARKKKKERAQRRLEREKRDFIQSTFKNMCENICLKTYQQALGIGSQTELPDCKCYPALPGPEDIQKECSCSCSEEDASVDSDTDSDEWIVEFTPPNAYYDPTRRIRKLVMVDVETQFSYLDYKVKLLDFSGNQVPRFFKSCDGREQCSDLGGFWGPGHKWLKINVDGHIAPDGRWAPNVFFGPSGEQVEAEMGKFQTMHGEWLKIGVDGYVDCQNKWKFYARRNKKTAKLGQPHVAKKGGDDPKSNQSWSCFGDVSPAELSKMGITGHGIDRKMLYKALKELVASGRKDVKLPDLIQGHPPKSPKKGKRTPSYAATEQVRCRHATPSDKGIVIDNAGHKRYFRAHGWKNPRPRERMVKLERQGRSLSSFHKPCFHSFISHETMLAQQRERLIRLAAGKTTPVEEKSVAVQTAYNRG